MKSPLNLKHLLIPFRKTAVLAMATGAGLLLQTQGVSAQTTNALDYAADPAYSGDGAPNGLSPGGQNGGYGFEAWTFTVNSTGGAFIQTYGPSGDSFDLWNLTYGASTVAIRPFGSALSAGQSFSVQLRLNSLDGTANTNLLALEDANGNILFSYYHLGGDGLNGHYTDASTTSGTAVNFHYDYQQFDSFTFTLNSATSYTFTDNTSGASISGIISGGPIAQVAFIRANGADAPGNGQDFQFDAMQITTTAGPPAPPGFASVNPVAGSFSVPTTNAISLQIVPGGTTIAASGVTFALDGSTVTPVITSGVGGALNVSYEPPTPLTAGVLHAVQVVVVDSSHNAYTNAWTFTAAFASLPAVLSGPVTVSNGLDVTIFTTNDVWLGTNFQGTSSQTIYARASMNVLDNAGKTGVGGFFCGCHFFEGDTARLLFGDDWISTNWSEDAAEAGEFDLTPVTPMVLDQWHTLVARIDLIPGQDANAKVWLDPDFTQTEANQPNAPLATSLINTFDNIRLRCGNGTYAITEFSNIVVAATGPGVGFAVPAAPQFRGLVPVPGAVDIVGSAVIAGQVVAGGATIATNAVALAVDGFSVSPTVVSSSGILLVTYTPSPALSAGTVHTVRLVATDANSISYTNTWSFTTAFASLPATLPGPFSTSNTLDVVVFSTNDVWIGTNYNGDSSKTMYVTFAMEFNSTNDTSGGVTWGGLDFYQDGSEKLLVGKNSDSPNWSIADSGATDGDVPPGVVVSPNQWHTIVVRLDYSPGADATANIWLDPDLTQPEVSQPNSPLTVTVDNTFDNIRLRCGFNDAMDTFSNIVVSVVGPFAKGGPATFQDYLPSVNASAAPVTSPISVETVFGTYDVSSENVTMTLDGTNVTPTFVVSASSITTTYQPVNPFAPGSGHSVTLNVTDSNGTSYSTSWSFTADQYPSLPLTQAGPLAASTGSDVILYTAQNEWIGGNYGPNSTNTLYARFSMTFDDFNGKTDNGGAFGGLEFYLGDTEHLLVGDNWLSTNWSVSVYTASTADIPPVTPIVLGDWHTMLVKCVYAGTNDTIKVWLDPDFTKSEDNQPNAALVLTMDNTFDNIHLRAGNGTAQAEYTNIVFAATASGVGLPAVVTPAVLSLGGGGGALKLSWTGTGTLFVAPAAEGPWTTAANQSNPQAISTTNSAQFFRLQQ
jgi:hypothetical protein